MPDSFEARLEQKKGFQPAELAARHSRETQRAAFSSAKGRVHLVAFVSFFFFLLALLLLIFFKVFLKFFFLQEEVREDRLLLFV